MLETGGMEQESARREGWSRGEAVEMAEYGAEDMETLRICSWLKVHNSQGGKFPLLVHDPSLPVSWFLHLWKIGHLDGRIKPKGTHSYGWSNRTLGQV